MAGVDHRVPELSALSAREELDTGDQRCWCQVRVALGHGWRGVAKDLLDELHGHTQRRHLGGGGVAEGVPADLWQAEPSTGPAQAAGDHDVRERPTVGAREDQAARLPRRAEFCEGGVVEGDEPAAVVLRRAEDAAHDRAADHDAKSRRTRPWAPYQA